MFLLFYNIIQIVALLVLGPILALKVYFTPKYKGRIGRRLGFGLESFRLPAKGKRVWVHALSVGEAASAQPLLTALRQNSPDLTIIFSSTTRGGEQFAQSMSDVVDLFVPFPLDIWFVVDRFLQVIKPDLFVLVETDFWPNLLCQLRLRGVPAVLVNGRITDSSVERYSRWKILFKNLFSSFSLVSMQTVKDAENMRKLGVDSAKIKNVGNLKFDMLSPDLSQGGNGVKLADFGLPVGRRIFVAGSTHPGEETLLLMVYKKLLDKYPDLFLVVAPRDVARGEEILALATQQGIAGWRRTCTPLPDSSVLVLDTLGELSVVYAFADVAFVGGSMVDNGGHNPLEVSVHGKPVVYGIHMNDFLEISKGLEDAGAAISVSDEEHLFSSLSALLDDTGLRNRMGQQGAELVQENRGAAMRYANLLTQILGSDAGCE